MENESRKELLNRYIELALVSPYIGEIQSCGSIEWGGNVEVRSFFAKGDHAFEVIIRNTFAKLGEANGKRMFIGVESNTELSSEQKVAAIRNKICEAIRMMREHIQMSRLDVGR